MNDGMETGCIVIVGIALLVLLIAALTGSELGGLAILAILVVGVFIFATRNS